MKVYNIRYTRQGIGQHRPSPVYTHCICGNLRLARKILRELYEAAKEASCYRDLYDHPDTFGYTLSDEEGSVRVSIYIEPVEVYGTIDQYRESGLLFGF
jgi:hypothetical protein